MTGAVFLDTVGLLALWNRRDQWHVAAKTAFAKQAELRTRLVTTSTVLLECGNAAARTSFRQSVVVLRNQLFDGGDLLEPTLEDISQAWVAYGHGEADQAGIVDHISFVVMRRYGLARAFSNDQHFRAAGFETLF